MQTAGVLDAPNDGCCDDRNMLTFGVIVVVLGGSCGDAVGNGQGYRAEVNALLTSDSGDWSRESQLAILFLHSCRRPPDN